MWNQIEIEKCRIENNQNLDMQCKRNAKEVRKNSKKWYKNVFCKIELIEYIKTGSFNSCEMHAKKYIFYF